jgi:hypothetical protein
MLEMAIRTGISFLALPWQIRLFSSMEVVRDLHQSTSAEPQRARAEINPK